MSFCYLQFSQKTNEKIQHYYYGTLSQIVFVHFLEELKTPKRHFEINWPLARKFPEKMQIFNEIFSQNNVEQNMSKVYVTFAFECVLRILYAYLLSYLVYSSFIFSSVILCFMLLLLNPIEFVIGYFHVLPECYQSPI